MIQKEKRNKEKHQNETIPIEILNEFLDSNLLDIPKELIPFTTLIDYPNTLLDLYKITYYTIKDTSDIANKVLIFTRNIIKLNEKGFNINEDFDKNYHKLELLKRWNIDIVNMEILEHLRDKQLLENESLKLIAKYRLVPMDKDNYIHLDTLEHYVNTSNNLIYEKDKKEKSALEKVRVPAIYNAKIPSGISIIYNKNINFLLKFNVFDKKNIIFKDLDTSFKVEDINIAIQHLQRIIINANDLIFLCNQVKYHYDNPFDKQHRRICIGLYGGQATGKTTTTTIIADLFNSEKTNNINFDLIKQFNKELQGTAFICLNEYKKTDESGRFIKRYSDSNTITINEKNIKMYEHPMYAMFMFCNNPSDKIPITTLTETRDNRNYLIEMEVSNADDTLDYLNNIINYRTIQTAMILIALEYPLELNEMKRLTAQRTQTMNLEKIDFNEFWSYLKEQLDLQYDPLDIHEEHQKTILISTQLFKKYFLNQREFLLKNEPNFEKIIELKQPKSPYTKTSAVKKIIKSDKDALYSVFDIKGSTRGYIISKELIKDIKDISIFEDTKGSDRKIIFYEKNIFNSKGGLHNKLITYLNKRKKNFIFQ